jgi:hypothetical protein
VKSDDALAAAPRRFGHRQRPAFLGKAGAHAVRKHETNDRKAAAQRPAKLEFKLMAVG